MNGLIDSKEYALAPAGFSVANTQSLPEFGPSVIQPFNSAAPASAQCTHTQTTVFLQNLLYVRALLLQIFAVILLIAVSHFAHADNSDYLVKSPQTEWLQLASLVDDEKRPLITADAKKSKTSWALAFDNDLLAPGHRDRDYTYGTNLTYSGESAAHADISLKTPLAAIDRLLKVDHLGSVNNYSVEVGLYGFTPKELERTTINETDRPYASLVYFSSSHEQIDTANNVAWNTTLTIGLLGLSFVGDLQNAAHQSTESKDARGWNHQISDGGELTGRYVIARQDYLDISSDSLELKSTLQASVGYLTETSWGLSLRAGKIVSPWASFNPDLISYGEKSTYSNNTSSTNEHYFWAGFALKARFYNAFLQGQFRDSDFSYSYSGLRPVIAEAWAGYTYAFRQGYRVSYVLRAQSSEIKHGDGDRNVVWGGLIFAKTI
ncbi:hypothetical protein GCM10011613_23100 [Cellvibrio zantedeschiae]|uniref:Lipid A deacylase LpxR family protein n=1 Tax=Cellvibrio zantedeschiae TaxID=1237077 RepID=A0ABQ3B4F3_9GAMM|nr:lipid A deacylase LpxR family protein [Cellvibrio zantedeschiae]GGY77892.1 hypothetical protein GCM10011613_23100 [Cellvibrio zantedeschiae]